MAVSMSITVEGIEELQQKLDRINPKKNSAWVGRAMLKAGLLVQQIATQKKIKRGGKGPPVAGILTSRTGTGRRSIRVNRSPLPWAVEIGTDLGYMAAHEGGWSGQQQVPSHTRTVAFGRKVRPFRVQAFTRHINLPPRPFLSPALDDAAREFEEIFIAEWAKEMP